MLEVLAFAKLNLTLEVLGRRSDGYHEVRTILQTIDLVDRLEVRPYHSLRVECDDPALSGQANLVWQAAVALATRTNLRPQASILIQKQIPVGMGLGGGSSDAAAALVALNRLWGLSMTTEELAEVAAGLGSDVPFFLWGGTALAEGRGEKVRPLPPLPSLPVTLICPNITIPRKTASLYSRLSPEYYTHARVTLRMEEVLSRSDFAPENLYNVFEQVAFTVFPGLGRLHQQVKTSINERVHLSGSGPSLFSIPSSEEEYHRAVKALQTYDAKVYFVRTISPDPFQSL
jgi:4-diphosphocytidyl-2-C-methyl-D-erythritol kinase